MEASSCNTGSPTIQNCIIRSNYQSGLSFPEHGQLAANCTAITGNVGDLRRRSVFLLQFTTIIKNFIFSGKYQHVLAAAAWYIQ